MACQPQRNEKSEDFKQELAERKIMRVTDGELMNFALKVGKTVIDSITNPKVVSTLRQWGITYDTLKDIKFSPTIKIAEVWEAYHYNAQMGMDVNASLQKDGDSLVYYTVPVVADSSLQLLYVVKMPRKELIKNYTDKDLIF